ncbi:MAG: TonB-dependent receptor [Alphaproteobacteria bacterium]|nr:TonB-dependent receptor [Alphaproteobacteria bacterium]MBL7099010.1 TonB-dependent receptor [Alphaproteobacteria bacterium]
MFRRVLLLTALIPTAALAAPVETVVVTASPPDPVGNAAFSNATVTAQDLHDNTELDRALAQVPGLSLFRRDSSLSANPTTQGVSLRSIAPSGAGRALVTLDGVPQNDPFGGWVIWSSLPPEDIAAAEIVRGAGAGPYGAGALTGTIALKESRGDGLVAADASLAQQNGRRLAAAGGTMLGPVSLFAAASDEDSDGWIPVSPAQRGAADNAVTYHARSASLRAEAEPFDDTLLSLRLGAYGENRDSGLVGATSSADGVTASLTLAHPQSAGDLGWRVQAWLRNTGFSNISATVLPGRTGTTVSNDQYSTPAIGWGFNAALRGSWHWLDWELGGDARFAQGDSKEHFQPVAGVFTQGRDSGGRTVVGGAYIETAAHPGDTLLVTLGIRADQWASTGGHLVQTTLATGVVTVNQKTPGKSGVVPTARLGARQELGDGLYVRTAAYEGFRAPTLNELYRPFRLGNNLTEANPGLTPEKLYGAELGAGLDGETYGVTLTAFWNRLHDAVTNVTVAHGPVTVPGLGTVPAGGLLIQRRNAGNIDAIGLEGDAHWNATDWLTLTTAFDYVDAHVEGGSAAAQLTGKQPAQAPRTTITAGFRALPLDRLTVSANLRYESTRYADDQNTLALPPATTVDARISYRLWNGLSAYAAGDNLFNARVATTESADFVTNYAAPRVLRIGVSWAE